MSPDWADCIDFCFVQTTNKRYITELMWEKSLSSFLLLLKKIIITVFLFLLLCFLAFNLMLTVRQFSAVWTKPFCFAFGCTCYSETIKVKPHVGTLVIVTCNHVPSFFLLTKAPFLFNFTLLVPW